MKLLRYVKPNLLSRFPEIAAEWSERNLPLTPDKVTAFKNTRVWWKCSLGHEWNTLISTRSGGSQCPYCSGIKLLKGFNDLATKYPFLAEEWSERNLPIAPDMVNEKSTKNVWWKCRSCGYEWKAVIKSRVKGSICPVCADRAVLEGHNDLATTDPELLDEWDYEKNGELVPTAISRNSMRTVWWKCASGHSWRAKITDRTLEEKDCYICEKEFLSVFPQLLIMLYGVRNGLKVIADTDNMELEPLIAIPVFIHDFLCIHPFNDGNGRMSRLLTTLLLYRCGFYVGKYISLEAKIAKNKDLYYDALSRSQYGWHEGTEDVVPFIKYLLGTILAAYKDFGERFAIVEEKLPAIDMVRKATLNKIGRFTKQDIREQCPSLSLSSVEGALRKLVAAGELKREGAGKSTCYIRLK